MKLFDRCSAHSMGFREVSPAAVAEDRGQTRLVDVREPHEFTGELGHVKGAELVPLATVGATAKSWSKDDDVVVICRSGGRSGRAAAELAQAGFARVMNMVGGMLAWNEAKLPTER